MTPDQPTVTLIAAVARNGVIGHDNALLWHLPQDMAHFRRVTAGCPVVMGRKTWDSLPERFRPLPGRRNIVVTRQPDWGAEGAEAVRSVEAGIEAAGDAPRIFVIGGAEIYAAALPRADELLLTEIDRDFIGDTRFPPWDRSRFREAGRETAHAAAPLDCRIDFVSYRRI